MKKTKEKNNKKNVQKLFYKTNPSGGISLIVLVITIIIIIILAAAVVVSIVNNNPMSEANEARIKSDVSNMQSIFTNAVGKVMAENQDVVTIEAGALNTVTSGEKNTVGNVIFKFSDGTSGDVIFDTQSNEGLKYYTGNKLPLYKQKTTWYVDEQGLIAVEVGNKKYGDGKIIKNIKITTNIEQVGEYIVTSAKVKVEILYEDEVQSITFGGNNVDIPEKVDGKYALEVEVTENGTYEIVATGKGGGKNTAKVVVNVIDDLNEEIKINSTVTLKDEFIKTVANIGLEIEYSGEIDSIKINGESVVVPSKTGGKYIVNKEVTKNGEYKVEVRSKDGTVNSKVVKVEIIEELNANIRIDATVSPKSDYTSADIVLVVSYSGEITSIKIEGESVAVPSKVNGKYNVSKNVLENGEYKIEVVAKDGTKNKMRVKVTQITEDMEIWNKADMEKFRNMVNSGRTFEGRNAIVRANIDLEGSISNKWTPVGFNNENAWSKVFKGTFEGNNFNINNLYIDTTSICQGLFGYGFNCTIKNVNVSGTVKGGNNTAGIIGHLTGTMSNCKSSVTVTGVGEWNAGGIVGYLAGSISDCTNNGNVTGTGSTGGIAGYVDGTVSRCTNLKLVTSNDGQYTGGIVGNFQKGEITKCINKGIITGRRHSGGIVGNQNNGTIKLCINNNKIVTKGYNNEGFSGGIVGYSSYDGRAFVQSCYNTGEVTTEISNGFCGGICGVILGQNAYASIKNCYNVGTITSGFWRGGIIAWVNTTGSNNGGTYAAGANYYLSTCGATNGIASLKTDDYCASTSDLNSKLAALGSDYTKDTININGGYPVLNWQVGK